MSAIAGAFVSPASLLRTTTAEHCTDWEGAKMVERESERTQLTQTPTEPRGQNNNSSRGG